MGLFRAAAKAAPVSRVKTEAGIDFDMTLQDDNHSIPKPMSLPRPKWSPEENEKLSNLWPKMNHIWKANPKLFEEDFPGRTFLGASIKYARDLSKEAQTTEDRDRYSADSLYNGGGNAASHMPYKLKGSDDRRDRAGTDSESESNIPLTRARLRRKRRVICDDSDSSTTSCNPQTSKPENPAKSSASTTPTNERSPKRAKPDSVKPTLADTLFPEIDSTPEAPENNKLKDKLHLLDSELWTYALKEAQSCEPERIRANKALEQNSALEALLAEKETEIDKLKSRLAKVDTGVQIPIDVQRRRGISSAWSSIISHIIKWGRLSHVAKHIDVVNTFINELTRASEEQTPILSDSNTINE
ncbi:hypothetical protein FQN54_002312 [Arachnomyces sp. PD_36]|nr:hypothetical protein FQN54_002312 [Arachnomyces sp. PD_36]